MVGRTPEAAAATRRLLHLLVALLTMVVLGCGSARPEGGSTSAPPAAAPAPQSGGAAQEAAQPSAERLIARNGRIELAVSDMVAAQEAATGLAGRFGGVVTTSSVRGDDGGERVAELTLRVPSARYDEAMAELRRLAVRVEAENTTTQDVTEEYSDTTARLRNLEATEAQYLDLLKRAQTVEDVLKVQQQLGQVRTQIDQLKGRVQLLQRRVDMSDIQVTLRAEGSAFRPLRHVGPAWQASLRGLEALVAVAIGGWWLWLFLGGLGWWLRRRDAKRRAVVTPPAPAPPSTA